MKNDNKNKLEIELIKTRYNLNLNTEQAIKIYEYEKVKDIYLEGNYFTFWEEMDYELSTFQKILTTEQLTIYNKHRDAAIQFQQESLIQQDNSVLEDIKYTKEIIEYHIKEFLPAFCEDNIFKMLAVIPAEIPKVNYLKTSYKEFLAKTKKEIIINHFRNYKTFSPKKLELNLLRHDLSFLWPEFNQFKYNADDITKKVIEYLKSRSIAQSTSLLRNSKIDKALEKLREFNINSFEKYYGKPDATTFVVKSSEDEDKESLFFTILLFDENLYGYIKPLT